LLEQRHAEQLKDLSEQLGSDREQLAVQNLSLEKQVSSLQEEESRLRIQVTTLQAVSIFPLPELNTEMKFARRLNRAECMPRSVFPLQLEQAKKCNPCSDDDHNMTKNVIYFKHNT
jgi:hypothetical protein